MSSLAVAWSPTLPAWSRRLLRFHALDALVAACLLLPALIFVLAAMVDRANTLDEAERRILATLDAEHARTEALFRVHAVAIRAMNERLYGLGDAEVAAVASRQVAQVAVLGQPSETLPPLMVFGPEGRLIAGFAGAALPPGFNLAASESFHWHRDHRRGDLRVQPAEPGARGALLLTTRRSAADGSFIGVIATLLRPETLSAIWQDRAQDTQAIVSLIREDGLLLARSPAGPEAGRTRLPATAPMMYAARSGAERVVMRKHSAVDGVERLVAVRRMEVLPAYLVHGVPRRGALTGWFGRLPVYGLLALLASLALFPLALSARRRAGELQRMAAELERRMAEADTLARGREASLRLLEREVDHRANNALAVVQATLRLTQKGDADTYMRTVEGRVSAIARAQSLLARDRWRGASLRTLIESEFDARCAPGSTSREPCVELRGPEVQLPPAAAQPLAQTIHELATNARTHGSLSVPGGRVRVSWSLEDTEDWPKDRLVLRWTETGGPPLAGEAPRRGFGLRVVDGIVRTQLAGALTLRWLPDGLSCEVAFSIGRLARNAAALTEA
jgi:two-component sensor histidine kinase